MSRQVLDLAWPVRSKIDRIVVLDQGRVAQEGRHAELMARNGVHARLVSLPEDLE